MPTSARKRARLGIEAGVGGGEAGDGGVEVGQRALAQRGVQQLDDRAGELGPVLGPLGHDPGRGAGPLDQYQGGGQVGVEAAELRGDVTTEAVADQHRAPIDQVEVVQDAVEVRHVVQDRVGAGVVAVAVAAQVDGDHPVAVGEGLGDRVEAPRQVGGAVQQHHRRVSGIAVVEDRYLEGAGGHAHPRRMVVHGRPR